MTSASFVLRSDFCLISFQCSLKFSRRVTLDENGQSTGFWAEIHEFEANFHGELH